MLSSLRQDLTYAIRSFSKAPALTATIIVSIALGIAANTTVFSMVNELLIKDMPVRDPGRLYAMTLGRQPSTSLPEYIDYRDQTGHVFEGLAAHSLFPMAANLSAGGSAQRIWGLLVSGNYFSLTGVKPVMGRGILPSEDQVRGRDPVVVLGYGLWRRLGADPSAIGKHIILSGAPYTIVGVAPPGFFGTGRAIAAEFWAPLAMRTHLAPDIAKNDQRRNVCWLEMTGRLRPDVSREQAVAALNVVHARIIAEHEKKGRRPGREAVVLNRVGYFPGLQQTVNLVMAALAIVVGLLLLIACANVANLLIARAASRQHEMGVRLALGAGRGRIVRQLLTESIVLASAGAALGFVLAFPGTAALARIQPPLPIPMRFDFSPDLRVLAFTTALAVFTGILFGLAPALTGTRGNLTSAIRRGGWGVDGSRHGRLASTLVVAQVALSLVLLVGSGLFLRSLQKAGSIDTGMKGEGALIMAIDPKGQGYAPDKAKRFFHDLQRRVEAIPGVEAMGWVDLPPLSLAASNVDFHDADSASGKQTPGDEFHVGTHYFAASGITLLRGRDFDRQRDNKAATVIVNQALADRLFGGASPIGRHIRFNDDAKEVYEVIGLVRNAKAETLGEGEMACAFRYLSDFDNALSMFGVTIMVRSSGDPVRITRAIRQQVDALDRDLPLFNVDTLAHHIDKGLLMPRVCGALFGTFGSIGLVLAVVGLYGVVNYSVRARTREIGIRMALGARASGIAGMVARQGLVLIGVGVALGLAIAFALSRVIGSLLWGITPTDTLTFAGVPAILAAVALVAILIPARRAARIEPTSALRYE